MTTFRHIDVLIAGAGPTGSTLAADLVRRGLSVRLVDKSSHGFTGSRAKGIQPRTLEVLEDLGVVHEALAEGGSYPKAGFHLGPFTIPWRMMPHNKITPDTPYPNILLLPQHRTDAILHRLLNRSGLSVEFNTAVESFEQDSEGVTTTLATGEKIRSRYLVGADGGSSTVRKSAGIPFVGETNDSDRSLIFDGIIDGLSRDRWHIWPRKKGKTIAACPLPHSDQFQVMIRLKPDDMPDLTEAKLEEQFHYLTGLRIHNITWKSVFRPNVRLVERYRSGRVFLAGDAAHVHTPAGGQGLNTGIQDAYNLGWKLAQVIAGAPESLLDSYEDERRPIAAQVLNRSNELYASMDQKRMSGLKRGDEERQLKLTYYGGPLSSDNQAATTTLRVGDRAPDAPCMGPTGQTRLFDIYQGPHFTLLAFGHHAAQALHEVAWPTSGAELHRYCVTAEPANGAAAACIADSSGMLSRIYGITGDTLILIRPDGYIGGIFKNNWREAFNRISSTVAPLH
ncbi:2-polyprenyl-6-methoxyphenol hydroxylase-like FAD-dependent oxidoreductase [Paenibacillus cellulosilyticus]|uniref:2-polyprenyl-6-methoxyphenol hydroxylase-like FAD-dependent oxidoreductase n=1 Tax=Paenibacillus cellulosilyticus TaxID=375489 RepID=A0A2V2YXL1_9BACL|nr:FAD-dependent oxidoreductase [Paenibacillus cellulosilyticus]PWW02900.1 2-polyprenyl-6-methoxyphenol hydroxylase-like FAD-dependent oxidoreductase [Paenibacillus cellulosilyticus]QKS45810.1 FAD-dependent oxidoreductase [Paenibacillus cellulosilyticus]